VAVFVMVTFAPTIAAPEGSVIVPESVAPATWERALLAESMVTARRTDTQTVTFFSMETSVPEHSDHLPEWPGPSGHPALSHYPR
jgi:hypothetical protein